MSRWSCVVLTPPRESDMLTHPWTMLFEQVAPATITLTIDLRLLPQYTTIILLVADILIIFNHPGIKCAMDTIAVDCIWFVQSCLPHWLLHDVSCEVDHDSASDAMDLGDVQTLRSANILELSRNSTGRLSSELPLHACFLPGFCGQVLCLPRRDVLFYQHLHIKMIQM